MPEPLGPRDASAGSAQCPVCSSQASDPFIHIPAQPIHCNLLWSDKASALSAPRGDIDLAFCNECGHIFNVSFDEDATQYGESYENSLHHSAVFQSYAEDLVRDLIETHDLRGKHIVEIGAGQGDFLTMLCEGGGNRGTGFDPSHVPTTDDPDEGPVRVVPAYYGPQFADHPADVIVCRHVLEHINASGDFVRMVRGVIGERSTLAVFEVPDANWTLLGGGVWDLIYEHCGYFTPLSLNEVFRRADFEVTATQSVFGGQFLVIEAQPADGVRRSGSARSDLASTRAAVGAFADQYLRTLSDWRNRLANLVESGRSAVVWGAGSKGVTFLNTVDTDGVITHVVDVNPRKRGRFVAGSGQTIVEPAQLLDISPDVVIIMNPNYEHEISAALDELGLKTEILVA